MTRIVGYLSRNKDCTRTAGQQKAFDDSWTWTLQTERVYEEVISDGGKPSATLRGMREIIGTSDMFAYVVMMTPRLVELRRVLQTSAGERLGYPTQKPVALLERVIAASSNEGDIVLDPFCGCGTAIEAAELPGRRWIGIDIAKVAIDVIVDRLSK